MSKIILVYHSIGSRDPFLQVPWNIFVQQIKYVITHFKPLKIEDFFGNSLHQNQCMIMFDDAFKDALPAIKYLDKHKIPYTVAVVDNFLDLGNFCNLNDLLGLEFAEYVFHTVSHKSLSELNDEELVHELTPFHSSELPLNSSVIVYPKGIYNDKILRCANTVGYKWGLTCLPFHLSNKYYKNSLEIPRININGYLPFWKFRLFLSPLGNAYLHTAFIKRKALGEDYLSK